MDWVALDDTDSPAGGCTTHAAVLLRAELAEAGAEPVGRPLLVRLNPNVPFKTRGNAAVALPVEAPWSVDIEAVVLRALKKVVRKSYPETRPGLVVCEGEPPRVCESVYKEAVRRILTPRRVRESVDDDVNVVLGGRGVVGAIAALGFARIRKNHEVTFEGIAYRAEKYWGTERRVEENSVRKFDRRTFPVTFDNLDGRNGDVLITPNTPCPVLYGVRSVEPNVLKIAPKMIETREPVVKYEIFESNQATDAHLVRVDRLAEAEDYSNIVLDLTVVEEPRRIPGGHVVVGCEDEDGAMVDIAAFRPTRPLTEVVAALHPGDEIRVAGALRPETPKHPRTVNVEKLRVLRLERVEEVRNPVCGRCRRSMKSAGRRKGFKCGCGERAPEDSKVKVEVPRELVEGVTYEAPPVARRHLSKPEYLVKLGLLEPSPMSR
ncbi:tRNA(Ile)(2)-agmatinylcytidine synthase [Methanopyrus sp. KOL6]|uniref:tRNA(Ile)(2)-agmatinylcytidine synthase n=1 Tax=Methanopyrus sp. KOL6 TaxID=1937004 RepID=UPI000B4B3487|nr:tRNA(Ile)(2)-agmatinylcytidine synthase [Methanopyrus sp. KOL6]